MSWTTDAQISLEITWELDIFLNVTLAVDFITSDTWLPPE